LLPPTNKSGTQRAYDAADSELNQIYQELMLKQTEANRQKLIRAELAWINFRDTNCAFQTSVYGGSTADCLTEVTQQRTQQLADSASLTSGT